MIFASHNRFDRTCGKRCRARPRSVGLVGPGRRRGGLFGRVLGGLEGGRAVGGAPVVQLEQDVAGVEQDLVTVPLLHPVLLQYGIDPIWFGVILAMNLQTSFLTPPFGFALFYLRSVAPAKEYMDKVTKKMIAPVTTTQIYWGAIPFLCIQILMVALVITFPGIVSSGLDKAEVYDLDKVRLEMEANMPAPMEQADPTTGMPGSEAPAAEDDPLKAMQESLSQDAEKKN